MKRTLEMNGKWIFIGKNTVFYILNCKMCLKCFKKLAYWKQISSVEERRVLIYENFTDIMNVMRKKKSGEEIIRDCQASGD